MKKIIRNLKSFVAAGVLLVAVCFIPTLAHAYSGCGINSVTVSPTTVTSGVTQIITTTVQMENGDCEPGTLTNYTGAWSGGAFTQVGTNTSGDTTTATWAVDNSTTPNGTYYFKVSSRSKGSGQATFKMNVGGTGGTGGTGRFHQMAP